MSAPANAPASANAGAGSGATKATPKLKELTAEQKADSLRLKDGGNKAFKAGEWADAIKLYSQVCPTAPPPAAHPLLRHRGPTAPVC